MYQTGEPCITKGMMSRILEEQVDDESVMKKVLKNPDTVVGTAAKNAKASNNGNVNDNDTNNDSSNQEIIRKDSLLSNIVGSDVMIHTSNRGYDDKDDDHSEVTADTALLHMTRIGSTKSKSKYQTKAKSKNTTYTHAHNNIYTQSNTKGKNNLNRAEDKDNNEDYLSVNTEHPELPPGWKVRLSRSKNRPYYVHPDHGATWYFPGHTGWKQCYSKTKKRSYFVHPDYGMTWFHPEGYSKESYIETQDGHANHDKVDERNDIGNTMDETMEEEEEVENNTESIDEDIPRPDQTLESIEDVATHRQSRSNAKDKKQEIFTSSNLVLIDHDSQKIDSTIVTTKTMANISAFTGMNDLNQSPVIQISDNEMSISPEGIDSSDERNDLNNSPCVQGSDKIKASNRTSDIHVPIQKLDDEMSMSPEIKMHGGITDSSEIDDYDVMLRRERNTNELISQEVVKEDNDQINITTEFELRLQETKVRLHKEKPSICFDLTPNRTCEHKLNGTKAMETRHTGKNSMDEFQSKSLSSFGSNNIDNKSSRKKHNFDCFAAVETEFNKCEGHSEDPMDILSINTQSKSSETLSEPNDDDNSVLQEEDHDNNAFPIDTEERCNDSEIQGTRNYSTSNSFLSFSWKLKRPSSRVLRPANPICSLQRLDEISMNKIS